MHRHHTRRDGSFIASTNTVVFIEIAMVIQSLCWLMFIYDGMQSALETGLYLTRITHKSMSIDTQNHTTCQQSSQPGGFYQSNELPFHPGSIQAWHTRWQSQAIQG
ncbi:hypothetical protein V6N11_060441 [Hibiscus sabdariffa]|uniref:Uncharacterized protein n=1 Tax=Hibiscus sabdariffa TaxID=183260 RepID=A0ABR2QQB4_9ROSI